MKKALVHDWFYNIGGAEKVVHSINNIWDDLEPHALIDFLSPEERKYVLHGKKANTSFIQKFPFASKNHRNYLQWFPLAIEQFNLSNYDLIISSSSSVAKGVLTHANQLHISYVHSPMRYAWDLYHQYLNESNLTTGLKGRYAQWVLHKTRLWDFMAHQRVDHMVANSNYIAKRIKKVYNRDAKVIYPPVDIEQFELCEQKDDFYITASRMVPYKKIDVIVEAFASLPDKRLVVIGDGPEMQKIKAKAKKNIEIIGFQPDDVLKDYIQKAKAFIFAAEEDFGIIPVESQACGTPVIAFNKGGAKETIHNRISGCFFNEQTPDSIINAIKQFDKLEFSPNLIRKNAERFSKSNFESQFKSFVNSKLNEFYN